MKHMIFTLLVCSTLMQAHNVEKAEEKSFTEQIKNFSFHDTFSQPFLDMQDSIKHDITPRAKEFYHDVEKATKKTYKKSSKAVKSWYENDVEPEMQHAKKYMQTQVEKITK